MKKLLLFLLLTFLWVAPAYAQNGIDEGLRALHVKVEIAAASGDQTILSAISGKKIKVLGYVLVSDTGTALRWESGGSTNISGNMTVAANGGVSAAPTEWGWMTTLDGESLVLNVGTASTVGGHVTYAIVD